MLIHMEVGEIVEARDLLHVLLISWRGQLPKSRIGSCRDEIIGGPPDERGIVATEVVGAEVKVAVVRTGKEDRYRSQGLHFLQVDQGLKTRVTPAQPRNRRASGSIGRLVLFAQGLGFLVLEIAAGFPARF